MKVFTQNAASVLQKFDIMVVLGKKRAAKAAQKLGLNAEPDIDCSAYTAYNPGDDCALVVVYNKVAKYDAIARYGVYAHEAVHCMQAWAESIGESDMGAEEQAYMVQCCFDAIAKGVKEEMDRKKS